jgi:hypothetical protein
MSIRNETGVFIRFEKTRGIKSPVSKDLRNFRKRFPIYQQGIQKGRIFKTLGDLKHHREIGRERS